MEKQLGRPDTQYRGHIARTLTFIQHGDRLLFIKGAPTKRLWANLYNGVGGHMEPGETVDQAAQREITEETGLEVEDLSLRVIITIDLAGGSPDILMFVFHASTTEAAPLRESEEGELCWFPIADLPTENMVEDLPDLIEVVLGGQSVRYARYWYDHDDKLRTTLRDLL